MAWHRIASPPKQSCPALAAPSPATRLALIRRPVIGDPRHDKRQYIPLASNTSEGLGRVNLGSFVHDAFVFACPAHSPRETVRDQETCTVDACSCRPQGVCSATYCVVLLIAVPASWVQNADSNLPHMQMQAVYDSLLALPPLLCPQVFCCIEHGILPKTAQGRPGEVRRGNI